MPTTLNVADKPTLNSVKTDTDTLITRGGIRHNGTNPQVYDTTNDTWVDLPSGGSLSPTIIIKNHFYWVFQSISSGIKNFKPLDIVYKNRKELRYHANYSNC